MTYPIVQARSGGASAAIDTTSHPITLPSGIVPGELLLVVFASDQRQILTVPGDWNITTWGFNGATVYVAAVWKIAEGSDSLTITTSFSTQSSHLSWRISGAFFVDGTSTFGSTTPNPFSHESSTWDANALSIVAAAQIGLNTASATPTGYTQLQTRQPSGVAGPSLYSAEKQVAAKLENADSFTTSISTVWAAVSLRISSRNVAQDFFPVVTSKQTTLVTTASTTHDINLPRSLQPNDIAYVVFAANSIPTVTVNTAVSGNNWIFANINSSQSSVTAITLYKRAEGNQLDALRLTTSNAQTSSSLAYRVIRSGNVSSNSYAELSGTSADPDFGELNFPTEQPRGIIISFATAQPNDAVVNDNNGINMRTFGHAPSIFGRDSTWSMSSLSYGSIQNPATNNYVVSTAYFEPIYPVRIELVGATFADIPGSLSTTTVSLSNLTSGIDTQPSAGDVVLVAYSISTVGRTPTPSVVTSGYTTPITLNADGTTYDTRFILAHKTMGQFADANVILSGTGNVDDSGSAVIMVFRGVDNVNPIDVVANTATGTGTGIPVSPIHKANSAGIWLMEVAAAANAIVSVLDPIISEAYYFNNNTSGTNRATTTISVANISDGDVTLTPGGWTGGSASAAASYVAASFALKPAYQLPNAGTVSAERIQASNKSISLANLYLGLTQAFAHSEVASGIVTLRNSFNISSITDNGVGNYSDNFTNVYTSNNYSFSGATAVQLNVSGGVTQMSLISKSLNQVKSTTLNAFSTTNIGAAKVDSSIFTTVYFGGL